MLEWPRGRRVNNLLYVETSKWNSNACLYVALNWHYCGQFKVCVYLNEAWNNAALCLHETMTRSSTTTLLSCGKTPVCRRAMNAPMSTSSSTVLNSEYPFSLNHRFVRVCFYQDVEPADYLSNPQFKLQCIWRIFVHNLGISWSHIFMIEIAAHSDVFFCF